MEVMSLYGSYDLVNRRSREQFSSPDDTNWMGGIYIDNHRKIWFKPAEGTTTTDNREMNMAPRVNPNFLADFDFPVENMLQMIKDGYVDSSIPNAREESINHLFLHGEVAAPFWDFFAAIRGVTWRRYDSLHNLFKAFRASHSTRSQLGMIATIIPFYISWEIWVERCKRKYEEGFSSQATLINRIKYWLFLANTVLPNSASRVRSNEQTLALLGVPLMPSQPRRIIIVRWLFPPLVIIA